MHLVLGGRGSFRIIWTNPGQSGRGVAIARAFGHVEATGTRNKAEANNEGEETKRILNHGNESGGISPDWQSWNAKIKSEEIPTIRFVALLLR